MTAAAETRTRRRWGPTILVVVVVLFSLVTFIWSAIETSTARVNATTEANSLFSAGTVELAQPFTVVDLIFDASNLYPGIEVVGCVEVQYLGSLPADVRLHAQMIGGSGLDEFIDLQATAPQVGSCDEANASGPSVYNGTLGTFWRRHNSYRSGVPLGVMQQGDTAVLHVVASLVDDNAAQGLTTDFSLTVEARP